MDAIPPRPVDGPLLDSVGKLTLAHEFTIGVRDGEPDYAFGQIDAVAARDDGGPYLCDLNDMQIREYGRAER